MQLGARDLGGWWGDCWAADPRRRKLQVLDEVWESSRVAISKHGLSRQLARRDSACVLLYRRRRWRLAG